MKKVLWIVDGDKGGLTKKASSVGAQAVCIRTTNDWLKGSVRGLKRQGFDVYAWRWPSVDPAANGKHHFADDEAEFAVDLIGEGLDGYIVDPESDDGRPSDDWNSKELSELADSFCKTIKTAGRKKNPRFLFGTTSGCDYPDIKPDIPYSVFLSHSDAAFPQIYWAPNLVKAHRTNPDDAWRIGMSSWKKVLPTGMKIVPILGEITTNKPEEIARFGQIMIANNLTDEVHFYAYDDGMLKPAYDKVWDALESLGTA